METKKPRRAIGNITARKNTKSSWQIQIDQGRDSITGKRLRSYENLKGTRREAERRLSALLRKPVFYTLLFTGMRRSEALALRWQDIDLDFGRLSIERSLHHLNDRTFHFLPPKTEKSRRLVALPPSLAMLLRHHRDNQRAMRLTMGAAVSNNDLVFAHVDGKHCYLIQSVRPGLGWQNGLGIQRLGFMMQDTAMLP